MANKKTNNVSFKLRVSWDDDRTESMGRRDWRYQIYEKDNIDPEIILQGTVIELIPQMRAEFNKFADDSIEEVRVQSVYEGSVIALFTVVWDVAKTVKDIYDITKMVTEVSELFIKGKLKEKFKYCFRVDTYALNRTGRNDEIFPFRNNGSTIPVPTRDAFFYYLVIANVVQALMIGALVFGAVIKLYF